jgi:arylsulfatase A-like enzyme
MRRFILLAITAILWASTAIAQTTRPVPQITRAMIISIDGLRPDVLLRAHAPRLQSLMHRGSFTFWARSTPASITLPTHVSMLTGVTPETHAVQWNGELPLSQPVYPRVPTLFELAKGEHLTTAMVVGKSKFSVLNKPGTIDFLYIPAALKSSDEDVIAHAVPMLREHQPQVMFVHFPGVDNVGHKTGWGTPEQLAAVTTADSCVGQLIDALDGMGLSDSTLLIVTSDHGGAGRTHGPDDPRSRSIPWIAVGPGIRRDFDLTRVPDTTVDAYDTFGTVTTMLGIPVHRAVRGKFIADILEDRELLQPPYESMQPTTNPSEEHP